MAAELIIRPARPEDRRAAERICTNTWDWGDYIPKVWDEWLADEQGQLAVAEFEGQIVALGRVRLFPGDQAWLEGMRVDPNYRRQGIAWQFFQHKLAYARALGARIARLGTSDRNEPVHRMMERAGMERVGRYEMLAALALPDLGRAALPGIGRAALPDLGEAALQDNPALVQLSPQHAGRVRAFLQQSPVLAAARGLYCLDWAWETLSEARAVDLLAAGQMVGQWAATGTLAALAVVQQEPDEERLWVGFADAGPVAGPQAGPTVGLQAGLDPEALRAFAQALRGQAQRWELKSVVAMLPDLLPLREAFRAADYGPAEWQGEMWIYEMSLDSPLAAESRGREALHRFGSAARGAADDLATESGTQAIAQRRPTGGRT